LEENNALKQVVLSIFELAERILQGFQLQLLALREATAFPVVDGVGLLNQLFTEAELSIVPCSQVGHHLQRVVLGGLEDLRIVDKPEEEGPHDEAIRRLWNLLDICNPIAHHSVQLFTGLVSGDHCKLRELLLVEELLAEKEPKYPL